MNNKMASILLNLDYDLNQPNPLRVLTLFRIKKLIKTAKKDIYRQYDKENITANNIIDLALFMHTAEKLSITNNISDNISVKYIHNNSNNPFPIIGRIEFNTSFENKKLSVIYNAIAESYIPSENYINIKWTVTDENNKFIRNISNSKHVNSLYFFQPQPPEYIFAETYHILLNIFSICIETVLLNIGRRYKKNAKR